MLSDEYVATLEAYAVPTRNVTTALPCQRPCCALSTTRNVNSGVLSTTVLPDKNVTFEDLRAPFHEDEEP